MLDGDAAGRQGTAASASLLQTRLAVAIIALEHGTQPDQLGSTEIMRLVIKHERATPGDPRRGT